MSLVSWPWRKFLAWPPVSASLPRSERSTRPQPSRRAASSEAGMSVVATTRAHRRTGGCASAGARPRAGARRVRAGAAPRPRARRAPPRSPRHRRAARAGRAARRCSSGGLRAAAHRDPRSRAIRSPPIMPLADTFQEILDSLPSDWTDMELDLRVDESRYIDATLLLVTINAQPYSRHDWHWRILVAHQFGHAAAAPAVHGTLRLLDEAGIAGQLELRELRSGRVETVQMWGRPESVRREFRRVRAQ